MMLLPVIISLLSLVNVGFAHIWSTANNTIFRDNEEFKIRGASWFGFETQDYALNGLWTHTIDYYLDVISQRGFNVLRVPLSSELIHYNPDLVPYDGFISGDQSLKHMKAIEILDRLFEGCHARGIYVMLDLHRLNQYAIAELWYDLPRYTEETFFMTWYTLLNRYSVYESLMAIDLLNEPHGKATWGDDDVLTDWRIFVEKAISDIGAKYPEWEGLFFVNGIEWGHTFRNYRECPLRLPRHLLNRTVLSPHVYGIEVVGNLRVERNYLEETWGKDWGFIPRDNLATIAVGEWGARMDTASSLQWANYLVDYLIESESRNNFYWSINPNSGDVHGLLDESWNSVDERKMSVIQRLQPDPTTIVV